VYRKIQSSIYIDKSDHIAYIKPQVEGDTFGSSINNTLVIPRGERINIGSSFYIIVSEDILLEQSAYEVPISGTIMSVNNSGFNISASDTFKMQSRNRYEVSYSSILVEFQKPISVDGGEEDDETFRSRVLLARSGEDMATYSAIIAEILSVPEISGYTALENKRGSGTLDIGITTNVMQETSIDESITSLLMLMNTSLMSVLPMGLNVELFYPQKLDLMVMYTSEHSGISVKNIENAVLDAFESLYTYNQANVLSAQLLQDRVYNLLPEANIVITELSLFDQTIDNVISISGNEVRAPHNFFMYLQPDNIIREDIDG